MIPFEPESIDSARRRYPEAVRDVYDLADRAIFAGDQRPGLQRKHVFDFEDGIRMIANRERLGSDLQLHVSASMSGGLMLTRFREYMSAARAMRDFQSVCEARFHELSQSDAQMDMVGWSPGKGVPHWRVKLEENSAVA